MTSPQGNLVECKSNRHDSQISISILDYENRTPKVISMLFLVALYTVIYFHFRRSVYLFIFISTCIFGLFALLMFVWGCHGLPYIGHVLIIVVTTEIIDYFLANMSRRWIHKKINNARADAKIDRENRRRQKLINRIDRKRRRIVDAKECTWAPIWEEWPNEVDDESSEPWSQDEEEEYTRQEEQHRKQEEEDEVWEKRKDEEEERKRQEEEEKRKRQEEEEHRRQEDEDAYSGGK